MNEQESSQALFKPVTLRSSNPKQQPEESKLEKILHEISESSKEHRNSLLRPKNKVDDLLDLDDENDLLMQSGKSGG